MPAAIPIAFDDNREDNTCHGVEERSRTGKSRSYAPLT
jgi:hypothetical protein